MQNSNETSLLWLKRIKKCKKFIFFNEVHNNAISQNIIFTNFYF